jgi:hypothetical protein
LDPLWTPYWIAPELGGGELFVAEAEAEGHDHVRHLLVLVDGGLLLALHVQDLPAQGQDGLELAVPRLYTERQTKIHPN